MQVGRRRWATLAMLGAVAAAAASCGDRGATDKTVVIALGDDADVIFPLLWTRTPGRVYTELMFDKLADIGAAQNTIGDAGYEPRLATSWTWAPDSLSIAFHLDPRARWQDSVPVRAADVRFAFQVYTDPRTGASSGGDMAKIADSVTVTDSLTATVWYKRRTPEQFHAIAYNLVPLPEHLLGAVPHDSLRTSAFARHPVGNGPFRFVAWEPSVRFELGASATYARGRPKLDRVVFTIFKDASALARAVFAGDADFVEVLQPDDAAEAARHPDVRLVPSPRYEYGFLSFNLRAPDGRAPSPIFADRRMRRALTMAVDRAAIVRNVYDSLGARSFGPFTRRQWSADTTIAELPYDTTAAARTLDSLGWTRGADGVRARGGMRLAFTITVMATNRSRPRAAELVQQQLARAGVEAKIDLLDGRAFGDRLASHAFDAALFSWSTSPSPSGLTQTWKSDAYRPKSPF
ncbi:MAG TPA: peptide ABC transporter substrate-binding protein, partial [Gemmatimonadaceae bacterium]|nr:peptide ABC transporter substrate-binding protein [Gemmatimonadaceae bacterium]